MKFLVLLLLLLLSLSSVAKDPIITIEYDVAETNKQSDILFVIDNSGSMSQNQYQLADNIRNFLTTLGSKVNYKIQVITTDSYDYRTQDTITNSSNEFKLPGQIRSLGTSGSPVELVFDNIWNFRLNHGNEFQRPDTNLDIIVMTDEEEQSAIGYQLFKNNLVSNNIKLHTILPTGDCFIHNSSDFSKFIDIVKDTLSMSIDSCDVNNFSSNLVTLAKEISKNALMSPNQNPPVYEISISKDAIFSSIKISYGSQVLERGLLGKGWILDDKNNKILIGNLVQLIPQPTGTKFTIQYEIK